VEFVPNIRTERVELRPLVESDVGSAYLAWFSDPSAVQFIESARRPQTIDSLRSFVRERTDRSDVWFHGMFTWSDGTLVGTIKCEPIDPIARVAVMGILIGDPRWRGVGLAAEVIPAIARALRELKGIEHLDLGVHVDNVRAVRAYERIGFQVLEKSGQAIRMRWPTCKARVDGGIR
jgi:RimJ/RimL family protein N-acetyltransferase